MSTTPIHFLRSAAAFLFLLGILGGQAFAVNGTLAGKVTQGGTSKTTGDAVSTPGTFVTGADGATLTFPGIGTVKLAPNTTVEVSFRNGVMTVRLVSGYALVTASGGSINVFADGQRVATLRGNSSSVDVGYLPGNPAYAGGPHVNQGEAALAGAGFNSPLAGGGGAGQLPNLPALGFGNSSFPSVGGGSAGGNAGTSGQTTGTFEGRLALFENGIFVRFL